MGNRSRTASLKKQDSELSVSEHETDAPILPVAQLERLQTFRPDKVDWYFRETERESQFRRDETKRVNTLIFRERLLGQCFALVIGVGGIVGGAWVALHGHPTAGSAIAVAAICTLAVVFLTGKNTGNGQREE